MSAILERRSLPARPASPMATLGNTWGRPAQQTGSVDIVQSVTDVRAPHTPAPHTMESRHVPSPALKPAGRILAIDDDVRLLQNFAMALESDGYSVETAETLADGLRLAATRPFHVCLLDHNIGYDSGIDALPRLRELAPLMRVIMVTGNAAVDDAVKAIALGASDYLALAQRFHTLVLDDIPLMGTANRNEARRFIILVDALYEHHVKLVASAAAEPHLLYVAEGGYEAFAFDRTVSRLIEMRSKDYLALAHGLADSTARGATTGLVDT